MAVIRYGVVLASVLGLAADSVTMQVSQSQYVNANRVRTIVFQGSISSRQAGEYVEILGRPCGARAEELVLGTQTSAGGSYRVEHPHDQTQYKPVYSGTVFRARWDRTYSQPYTWRYAAQPRVARISGTRIWVAHVSPATPQARCR